MNADEARPDTLKDEDEYILIDDELLAPNDFSNVSEAMEAGRWTYGWRSIADRGAGIWHMHFAGGTKDSRTPCESEIAARSEYRSLADLWLTVRTRYMPNHVLLRAYANGQTFGLDGAIRIDHRVIGECRTTLVYMHPTWAVSWGGETCFYARHGGLLKTVSPDPGRIVVFDSSLPHAARAPTREAHALRVALVFKSIDAAVLGSA